MDKLTARVLRHVLYQDRRYMLYAWTRERGPLSFSVISSRGAGGLMHSGQIRPLQELDLVVSGPNQARVLRVREMSLTPHSPKEIRGYTATAWSVVAEWLAAVLAEGQPEPAYYDAFTGQLQRGALLEGQAKDDALLWTAVCVTGLSRHLGFAPDPATYLHGSVLSGNSGLWLHAEASSAAFSPGWCMGVSTSHLYAKLLSLNLAQSAPQDLSKALMDMQGLLPAFLTDLARYFQEHASGFRVPRYLPVLLEM